MALSISLQTVIGISASAFCTVSLVPQLIKIIREKDAGNISVWMLVILLLGLFCWIGYGYLANDMIILIANSISAAINSLIIFFAIKFRGR